MPDVFRSLDVYLREGATKQEQRSSSQIAADERNPVDVAATSEADTLREVRRFRVALADAVEAVREDLLRDLAADVLGRELRLAPPDIARIVASVLERAGSDEMLKILVHPDDVAALNTAPIPVQSDIRLRRGDASIVLRYGTIDASLGVRLADVLERYAR